MVIDNAFHAFFERCTAEVDQQPYGLPCQSQIGKQLLAMGCGQPLGRFDFDNQATVNQQVNLECSFKAHSVKIDIDGTLASDGIAHPRQPACKKQLIDAFQQARPQFAMQLERYIENIAADLVDVPHFFSAPPRLRVNPKL